MWRQCLGIKSVEWCGVRVCASKGEKILIWSP